jgi:hypothetical protein
LIEAPLVTRTDNSVSSDLSGYITGQTLVVDGGVGAKFPYPMPEE